MNRDKVLRWLKTHRAPGWYHNGGFGSPPTIEATVTKKPDGYMVTIYSNGMMYVFNFSNEEI